MGSLKEPGQSVLDERSTGTARQHRQETPNHVVCISRGARFTQDNIHSSVTQNGLKWPPLCSIKGRWERCEKTGPCAKDLLQPVRPQLHASKRQQVILLSDLDSA